MMNLQEQINRIQQVMGINTMNENNEITIKADEPTGKNKKIILDNLNEFGLVQTMDVLDFQTIVKIVGEQTLKEVVIKFVNESKNIFNETNEKLNKIKTKISNTLNNYLDEKISEEQKKELKQELDKYEDEKLNLTIRRLESQALTYFGLEFEEEIDKTINQWVRKDWWLDQLKNKKENNCIEEIIDMGIDGLHSHLVNSDIGDWHIPNTPNLLQLIHSDYIKEQQKYKNIIKPKLLKESNVISESKKDVVVKIIDEDGLETAINIFDGIDKVSDLTDISVTELTKDYFRIKYEFTIDNDDYIFHIDSGDYKLKFKITGVDKINPPKIFVFKIEIVKIEIKLKTNTFDYTTYYMDNPRKYDQEIVDILDNTISDIVPKGEFVTMTTFSLDRDWSQFNKY